jgi:hypothetical protein
MTTDFSYDGSISIRVGVEPWDVVYTFGFDTGPAGILNLSSSLGQIISRDLSSPIGFDSLFDFTIGS